jgi:hypothetical protein
MKILLYTISDFKPFADQCINLMLSSINFDISCDFLVISDKQYANYPIIVDNNLNSNYIGYLKYSLNLPSNYDYYIYLDSDILYFDKISKLINNNNLFSIVKEDYIINSHEWFYFKHIEDTIDQTKIQKCYALNAGSFCFHNSKLKNIHNIYYLYQKYFTQNIHENAKIEQSIFNYIIHKITNYSLKDCYDLTPSVELFASNKSIKPNKTLYHFCGFSNEMSNKYICMKDFYDKFKR